MCARMCAPAWRAAVPKRRDRGQGALYELDAFAPDGDDLERILYGFSLFVCLPDGLSSPRSVGTGTVMRPSTLRRYGETAGFNVFEILPIEDFGSWRFYRLS
jgi:hypothetical protein